MICSKCGNELKEGRRYCGQCGAPVELSEPVQEPQAAEPEQTVQKQAEKPVGKIRYAFSTAPIKVKILTIISILLVILSVALMTITSTSIMVTPITDITVVDIVLDKSSLDDDYRAMMSDLRYVNKDLEDFDSSDGNVSYLAANSLRNFTSDLSEFLKVPSAINAFFTLESFENINIYDFEDEPCYEALLWLDNIARNIDDDTVEMIPISIYATVSLVSLLLLLGLVLRNITLTVIGTILSVLFCLSFASTLILISSIFALVIAAALQITTSISYKKYTRTFL